ncbi:hypothetical protein ACFQFC_04240 [Amorphoplanes digitatis]|uniref:Uncharacterized protein n=1 Tax=Actinoplanes digitatis TaxID=1868 RepID=A0A7W7HZ59_9ACTN|nr:hypothetical protein [Actinoplanes digitatis]MBB4763394.1 hypothetical protein [Actinoplanes digitatis]GID92212.1 hypothetical protein Adi01nite_16240 [Actinoplanes digitatis]
MTDYYDGDCGCDDAPEPFDEINEIDDSDGEIFDALYDDEADRIADEIADEIEDGFEAVEALGPADQEPSIVSIANGDGYPGGYAALPVSGDTAALIQQLNGQLATVRELGDVGDLGAAAPGGGPVQDTLDMIHNLHHASPETLNWLNGMANAESAYGEVSNQVYKYEQTH